MVCFGDENAFKVSLLLCFPCAAADLNCKQKLLNRLSITRDPPLGKHCISSDPLTPPRGRLTGVKLS